MSGLYEGGGGRRWVTGSSLLVDEAVPALLRRLTAGPLELETALDQLCEFLSRRYQFNGYLADPANRRTTLGHDLVHVAEMLTTAGLATFEPAGRLGGRLDMTPAGAWWVALAKLGGDVELAFELPPIPSAAVHELSVILDDAEPTIWRQILVPSEVTLTRLHAILQIALGWQDCHLHVFEIAGKRYGEPSREDFDEHPIDERMIRLGAVAKAGESFSYQYDFGDSWDHTIKIRSVAAVSGPAFARCTHGSRACPPEDVGGVWGYARMLAVLRDPDDEEYESYLMWAGPDFDPDRLDLTAVNEALRRISVGPAS